jgi:uncharacterized protein YbaR (Trm112 family)
VRLASAGGSIGIDRGCRYPLHDAARRRTTVVALDPRLMEILACPSDDHAPLRAGTSMDPDADVLTCTSCGRGFPVVDGIPVLLLDEASPPVHARER